MRVRINEGAYSEREMSLEDYAERCLDGSDYDRGKLEAIAKTSENNSRAIARLLGVLAGKKLLTEEDIAEVLCSYDTLSIVREEKE